MRNPNKSCQSATSVLFHLSQQRKHIINQHRVITLGRISSFTNLTETRLNLALSFWKWCIQDNIPICYHHFKTCQCPLSPYPSHTCQESDLQRSAHTLQRNTQAYRCPLFHPLCNSIHSSETFPSHVTCCFRRSQHTLHSLPQSFWQLLYTWT